MRLSRSPKLQADGSAVITKLAETGGCVTHGDSKRATALRGARPLALSDTRRHGGFQPRRNRSSGPDRVRVSNAGGSARPETLKVTVGFDGGFQGEAGVSYAGPAAQERGNWRPRSCASTARDARHKSDLRVDLIGVNSLFATAGATPTEAQDVRLHVALRSPQPRGCRDHAVGSRIAAVLRTRRRRRLPRRHHALRDDEIGVDRARTGQADLEVLVA